MAGQVSFQLTEEDCVAAYRDHLRKRFRPSGPAWIAQQFSAVALLLLVIIWAISRIMSGQQVMTGILPAVVAMLACFWLLPVFVRLGAARAARRMFSQRAAFQRSLTYEWSVDGLSVQSTHGTSHIP